jgi:hypothetical protein
MAIVINGSGTVTGLAVGGLPDGIVDAGTLATDSVDSAEIVDGSVDDSHIAALAASKLTGALPAISGASLTGITTGKVLQVVTRSSSTTASNQTANQWNTTDTYVNITPSATSSKILVIVGGGQIFVAASDGRGYGTIYRDSTNIGNSSDGITNGYAASSNIMVPLAGMAVLDSPSSTSQITYKVYTKSDRTSHYNYDTTLATVTALEIAG